MENMYTKEIKLKDLFFFLLLKWRALIVSVLVFGILLSGFGAYRAMKTRADKKAQTKAEEEYEEALSAYETSQEKIQIRIDNLERSLEQQQYIQEHSVMLKMDPYNIYEAVISYYVDTGYEIVPELYYQDPDYTAVITNSYNSAITRIDLNELFQTENDPEVLTDNPVVDNTESLLWAKTDADHGSIKITMRADSQENLDRVIQAVEDEINETKTVLTRTIGEHTLSVLSFTTHQVMDFDYVTLQQSFNDNIYTLMQSLADSNNELSALEKPKAPTAISVSVKREAVKFGAIGTILGVFLFAVAAVIQVISRESVMSLDEISERYQIPVLGIYSGGRKKRWSRLDAWIAGRLGVSRQDSREELKYIQAAKRLYLKSSQVLLVSISDPDRLGVIAEGISDPENGTAYSAAGSIADSAEALTALQQAESVICVERWRKITHEELRKEVEMIQRAVPKDQIAVIITF